MPGLLGFWCREQASTERNGAVLDGMLAAVPGARPVLARFVDDRAALAQVGPSPLPASPGPTGFGALCADGFRYAGPGRPSPLDPRTPEGLTRLIEEHGTAVQDAVQGTYQLAVYEKAEPRLWLANDRLGMLPLYLGEDEERCYFSFSLAALRAVRTGSETVNRDALFELLLFHFILEEATLLQEVQLLAPGSLATPTEGGWQVERTWEMPAVAREAVDPDEAADRIWAALEASVERFAAAGLRCAVQLSGGLDSRLLAGLLGRHQSGVPAIHVAGIQSRREEDYAREAAQLFEATFHRHDPAEMDLAASISAGLSILDAHFSCNQTWLFEAVSRSAADVDLVLDGVYFDAQLGSHRLLLEEEANGDAELSARLHDRLRQIHRPETAYLFRPEIVAEIEERTRSRVEQSLAARPGDAWNKTGSFFAAHRARRYLAGMALLGRQVAEFGFPFLDYELFELCRAVPVPQRRDHALFRHMMLRHVPDWGRIPWGRTDRPLSRGPLERRRHPRWGYRLARVTGGRFEYLPPGNLNRLLRKNREFRNFVRTALDQCGDVLGPFLAPDGLARLWKSHDRGHQILPAFQSLLNAGAFLRTCEP